MKNNYNKLIFYILNKYLENYMSIPDKYLERFTNIIPKNVMDEINNDIEFWEKHPRDY